MSKQKDQRILYSSNYLSFPIQIPRISLRFISQFNQQSRQLSYFSYDLLTHLSQATRALFINLYRILTSSLVFYTQLYFYICSKLIINSQFKNILPNHQMKQQEPHQQQNTRIKKRKNSIMDIPIKKFAAQQFDQKAVILCQFCGGQSCKQQDYRTNKIQPNAIQGLHCNWITHNILAMQRPSERLIKQYNLYEKFKKEKINTILNLQEPGEHPYCGDGLLAMVGFSYNPEGFYMQGIKFFNQSWEDMTATTFQHMMRIMNIFYLSLVRDQGKISVHCHAGRGRTLLVICSWLIYYDRFSPKTTIDIAVQRREGVLTRSSQRQFLSDFQAQLKLRWISYGETQYKSFSQFVSYQKVSYLKHEQTACKFRPYVHSCILQELRQRIQKDPKCSKQIMMAMLNSHSQFFKQKWDQKHENELKQMKKKINNHLLFNRQQKLVSKLDCRILTQLLYDFYDQLPFVLISVHSLESLLENSRKKDKKMSALFQPQFIHQAGVEAISVMLDLIHFLKALVKQNLNLLKQQSEDSKICQCLFIRLSILLSTKRKYCHKVFPQKYHNRQCKLIKYEPQKRQRYTSKDQIKLAQFMQSLTPEIEEDLDQLDDHLLKVRKVDSNLHYFTKSHESEDGFFKKNEAKQIYDKSRI